jgi:hypothetical protein
MRFSVTQIANTGTYSGTFVTTGNYQFADLQLNNTTDAVSGVSNGALNVLGGATIAKNLNTLNLNATGSVTAANLRVPGTLTVTNVTVNNLVQSSGSIIVTGNSNTIGSIITTGGNVGIGTTAPRATLDVNGALLIRSFTRGQIGLPFAETLWLVQPANGTLTGTLTLPGDCKIGLWYANGAEDAGVFATGMFALNRSTTFIKGGYITSASVTRTGTNTVSYSITSSALPGNWPMIVHVYCLF